MADSSRPDERFKRIEEIYQRALERPEAERGAFVAGACGSDEDLRREMEKLLSFDGKAGKFMDSPALDVAARALAKTAERSISIDLIGQTILHYRLTEKIGEGGMGVVYKALDTHLNRPVAIKVLPHDRVSDPERKRRFVQEARAASALNHPNIVTIYDIDQAGGVDFIAMEYVAGKTLDELIPRKGMKLSDTLKCSIQIAEALAAAHAAGIVHRDLKPANVMVTEKGLVKVLDFGLAKLTEPVESDEFRTTETVEPRTEEGTIVGTVAYMSPEQSEGKKVDARSDIFSMGSVLYEMVTGQKAFQGTSKISTLSAILHQEPKPISGITQTIPAELEKLIHRCLRKDPERRWQAMADLKVALQELKEDSDSGRLQAAPAAKKQVISMRLVIGAVAVLALITVAVAAWYWLSRQRSAEPEAPLRAVPLTSYPGYENVPSFSPDGNFVAFEWCGEARGANCDIYVKQIGEEPPLPLTSDPAVEFSPAWSPDGLFIAFLRQVSRDKSAVVVVPQRGGQGRVLGESDVAHPGPLGGMPFLAWTQDSKRLVIPSAESDKTGRGLFLLSLETLERRRLTDGNDGSPAFSPDGRSLVFTRRSGGKSDIYLLRLGVNYEPQGSPQRVGETGEPITWSATWTSDGSEIVSSSGSWTSGSLWRMTASASAKPRRLAVASEDVGSLAVSRKGNRLAYNAPWLKVNIWRVDLRGPSQTPGTPFLLIGSTRTEWTPTYSPDGKRIAFCSDRSGHLQIWVCDSDGSNAQQLTSLGGEAAGTAWSSDGGKIAFGARVEGSHNIYVISASGGAPRRLTDGPNDRWPCWSRDSQSIYFGRYRSGEHEIWKMPAAGGEAVQITRNGGDVPQVSPDGKFLYYLKLDAYPTSCSVWRMPVGGGEETKVLDSVHCAGHWAFGGQGIYFFAKPDEKGRSDIRFYEFATGSFSKILTVDRDIQDWIAASPDSRTILYTQMEAGSDLMLVENFR